MPQTTHRTFTILIRTFSVISLITTLPASFISLLAGFIGDDPAATSVIPSLMLGFGLVILPISLFVGGALALLLSSGNPRPGRLAWATICLCLPVLDGIVIVIGIISLFIFCHGNFGCQPLVAQNFK